MTTDVKKILKKSRFSGISRQTALRITSVWVIRPTPAIVSQSFIRFRNLNLKRVTPLSFKAQINIMKATPRHLALTTLVSSIALLVSCGGGDSSTVVEQTPTPVTPNGVTVGQGELLSAAGFGFVTGREPLIRIREINDDEFVDPSASSKAYKPGDLLPIEANKTYIITLSANTDPASQGTVYISNTRPAAGEDCLTAAALTTRSCPESEGRPEQMPSDLVWRAVIDTSTINLNSSSVFVTPVTTLVAERTRVLTTPRGGSLGVKAAMAKAEAELRASLLPQTASPLRQIAQIEPRLENLTDTTEGRYGLLLGAFERLTQQMAKTVGQVTAPTGYSGKYNILFASFARDGRFETLQENVQGNSVGLRSVSSLLNAALTEHLLKDAPRYKRTRFSNFRAEDFFLSPAGLATRNVFASVYGDLYDSTSGSVTSIPYVSASSTNSTRDHNITVVAARTAGLFFLDSRGEAQDGAKNVVQCSAAQLGAPAGYEVTGVLALDGAATPMVLAYSHTDTRAYLIDIRKVGLDQAGSTFTCGVGPTADTSGFRQIDFRDAITQNASLYQSAAQYQHTVHGTAVKKPVTLTGGTYDSRTNRLLLTTIDGVLAYDVIPTNGGTAATGTLNTTTRYRDFAAFPVNSSNAKVGLSMNPTFDNTNKVLWSPYDYDQTSKLKTPDDFRGLFAADYSDPTPEFSSKTKRFSTANSADVGSTPDSMLGSALNLQHGVAMITGYLGDYQADGKTIKACGNTETTDASGNTIKVEKTTYNTIRLVNAASSSMFNSTNGSINLGSVSDLSPYALGQQIIRDGQPAQPSTPGAIPDPLASALRGPASSAPAQLSPVLTPLLGVPGTAATAAEKENCVIGYHGLALENRLRDSKPTATTGLYAVTPVLSVDGFVKRGMVSAYLISSPRFAANLTSDKQWKPLLGNNPRKDFVILPQAAAAGSNEIVDPRRLVLDDIRSYGVLRQRGTFPKSLAYFLTSEPGASGGLKYALIEADLEAISQIPNTTTDSSTGNSSYVVSTTGSSAGQAANPVRVYFR